MKKVHFYKFQASGNDFVLLDKRKFLKGKNKGALSAAARKICLRKTGVGADGLLFIEPSRRSDFKMRIFNADGSEAEMCANGARCAALWKFKSDFKGKAIKFDTQAGVIEAFLKSGVKNNKILSTARVKIKVTDPFDWKKLLMVKVLGRNINLSFINTGVPHAVIFVEGLNTIDVERIGRAVRYNKFFFPYGTNVNFVEAVDSRNIKIRTYERGVESETLACGTGCVASAIVYTLKRKNKSKKVTLRVKTKGGEVLTVNFQHKEEKIQDVWLEGKASLVYEGVLHEGKI